MPQVWKEIIRVGKHAYIDGETGQPKVLDATPEAVKYWFDQGKMMRSAGLSIPIPLEHQDDAKPMTAAERAASRLLNNAGFVEDFDFRKVKDEDGQEVDAVFGLHDLDPAVIKRAPRSVRWVSPWLGSFTDGENRKWNGVITHSALTTRPRITRQEPFPDLSAALSLAVSHKDTFDPAKYAGKGIALSRAGLLRQEGQAFKPAYPMAFSLYSGVKLAVEMVKEKVKEKVPEKAKLPAKEGEVAAPGADEIAQEVESLVDADGDISVWDVICDLLESEGYTCPEGITAENAAEQLYRVFMDKVKSKGSEMPNEPVKPAPGQPPRAEVQAPPVFMSANFSLEDANKIADPTTKAIALSLLETRAESEKLKKNAIEGARLARKSRVDTVKAKLPKDAADRLQKVADGAKFSLGDDGVVKDDFADMLEVFERGMNIDVPELLKNPQAALAVMPHPEETNGGMSEARRQAIVNEARQSAGGQPVYKETA